MGATGLCRGSTAPCGRYLQLPPLPAPQLVPWVGRAPCHYQWRKPPPLPGSPCYSSPLPPPRLVKVPFGRSPGCVVSGVESELPPLLHDPLVAPPAGLPRTQHHRTPLRAEDGQSHPQKSTLGGWTGPAETCPHSECLPNPPHPQTGRCPCPTLTLSGRAEGMAPGCPLLAPPQTMYASPRRSSAAHCRP